MNRAARRSRDGRDKAKAQDSVSWLGRWSDLGWAIKIGRKLSDAEWRMFGEHADETWNSEARQYSPQASLTLLGWLFPDVTLELVYPQCNKRLKTEGTSTRGLPVFVLCDKDGTVSEHIETAGGQRVCVVRCMTHAGEL